MATRRHDLTQNSLVQITTLNCFDVLKWRGNAYKSIFIILLSLYLVLEIYIMDMFK